jgi:homospermidine synthase
LDDFKKNHIKHLTLIEVQNQNRYQIEESFLKFIQNQITEEKIAAFVEALAEHSEFKNYLKKWIETE